MNLAEQAAKHIRDVHFGGNYTGVHLKGALSGITWQQATTKVHSLNTIGALVFHINYYASAVLKVLQGGPLDAHDKYSYDHPPIQSQEDWDRLVAKLFTDAETLAALVEQQPERWLNENFLEGKYGTWFRNLQGMVEHTHYHLGQISLIKKILLTGKN